MKYFLRLSLIIFLLGGGFYFTPDALAVTVSPVKLDLEADPGQTLQGEIELYNEQKESKTFFSSFANFEARGESGAPFFTNSDSGLATWLTTKSEVTLEPGARVTLPFTLAVPAGVEPGGYFAAIFWGTASPQPGSAEVSISGKIGVLVLLTVRGDTEQGAGILNFSFNDSKIITGLPTIFSYRFSNDGGARVRPVGQITIKNIFGQRVAILEANPRDGNVLPKTIRKIQVAWQEKKQDQHANIPLPAENAPRPGFWATVKSQLKNFMLGFYRAKLNLTYGPESIATEKKMTFFVFPWQLSSLVLALLLIIILGFRQYNKWLIKRVTGGQGAGTFSAVKKSRSRAQTNEADDFFQRARKK